MSKSKTSSSSPDFIPTDRDFAGDKMLKELGYLDIDPDETTPQTITQYKKEIVEMNEFAEEMRLDLEARKRLVKEHKLKIAKYREEIRKLQEEEKKAKMERLAVSEEIKGLRDNNKELSKKIGDFNILQEEVKRLKEKLKGLKSKQMEERQKANIAKGKKPKEDRGKDIGMGLMTQKEIDKFNPYL